MIAAMRLGKSDDVQRFEPVTWPCAKKLGVEIGCIEGPCAAAVSNVKTNEEAVFSPLSSLSGIIVTLPQKRQPMLERRNVLRSEFDQHPLWATTAAIVATAEQIRDEHEAIELPKLETILFYVTHAETFREIATTSSALFSSEMLNNVNVAFTAVLSSLQTRAGSGVGQTQYVDVAVSQSEASLIPMAPWPRPYGKGGQVTQMSTLYEDLLERQRLSVEALAVIHAQLREQLTQVSSDITGQQRVAEAAIVQMQAESESIIQTVIAEKVRIDQVVEKGLSAVASVEAANTERYKEWRADREASFENDFSGFKTQIVGQLAEATDVFEKLKRTNEQFENLSAIAAGETIANNFQLEAKWGRRTGITMYAVGGVFLLAATVPLIWLLFEGGLDVKVVPQWGLIAVRVAIGILAGSAATVVIRLGARLISDANASKRMELELRSVGPFLANVVDPAEVDAARIALVARAFGQREGEVRADPKIDTVQVTLVAQLIDLLTKAIRPNG